MTPLYKPENPNINLAVLKKSFNGTLECFETWNLGSRSQFYAKTKKKSPPPNL